MERRGRTIEPIKDGLVFEDVTPQPPAAAAHPADSMSAAQLMHARFEDFVLPEPPPRRLRLAGTKAEITLPNDDVRLRLLAQAPQEHNLEAHEAREAAATFAAGKQITFGDERDSVTYEIVEWDDHLTLLRRMTKTEVRRS